MQDIARWFMKVDGVEGDSVTPPFLGYFDVSSISWSFKLEGGGIMREPIAVEMPTSKGSPILQGMLIQRDLIAEVAIYGVTAEGRLAEVIVLKRAGVVAFSGNGDVDSLELYCAEFAQAVRPGVGEAWTWYDWNFQFQVSHDFPLPLPSSDEVIVDMIAPARPTLALLHDNGVSATDRITNDAALTIGGAEIGAAALWTVDGAAVAAYDPAALADGDHAVTVQMRDASGNLSSLASIAFTLDRSPPTLSVALATGDVNHLGRRVSGTIDRANAGMAITLTDNAGQALQVTADATGRFEADWMFTPGAGGLISINATASDAAGNVGTANASMQLNFSANAPLFKNGVTNIDSLEGEIIRLYDGVLGRLPTDAELAAAKTQALGGASMTTLAGGLLTGAAFQQAYGTTAASLGDAQLVAAIYAKGLGRQGTAQEIAVWSNAIPGLGRDGVAAAIALSAENRGQVAALPPTTVLPGNAVDDVARLYYGLLERAPDLGGLVYWNAVENNATLSTVAAGIMGSSEFLDLHGADQPAATFIQDLYQAALGRTAANTELDAWANALTQGASRADVAVGIADSAEARARLAPSIESGWWLA